MKVKAVIIAAIVTAIGSIIAALLVTNHNSVTITQNNQNNTVPPSLVTVTVNITDGENNRSIPGADITVTDSEGKAILTSQAADSAGQVEVHSLKDDVYTVNAKAPGYTPVKKDFNIHSARWDIQLQRIVSQKPFSFTGWSAWSSELRVTVSGNTAVFSGDISDVCGFQTLRANRNLAGKKLILEVTRMGTSQFYNNQLFKVEVDDNSLPSDNETSHIEDDYLPAGTGAFEFTLPNNFNGKINVVFYKAALSGLEIAAFYKD